MRRAAYWQRTAYSHEKDCAVALAKDVFALLWRFVWKLRLNVFRMDESNVVSQKRLKLRIFRMNLRLCLLHRAKD